MCVKNDYLQRNEMLVKSFYDESDTPIEFINK